MNPLSFLEHNNMPFAVLVDIDADFMGRGLTISSHKEVCRQIVNDVHVKKILVVNRKKQELNTR